MLQTNSDTIRLDFAKALAREVGILAREMQKNLGRVEQKGHQDYVSEVDRNIEAIIRDKVIEVFPGDVMLGEELGGQTGDSLWVVDPIDGTSNFVRGQSFWCVSISYMRDGKPVVGVIYAPATDELFYARAGQGAFCNGAPMQVKKVNNESEAVIELDWSPSESPEELISMLAKFLKAGFEFHRSGSCALCLANVANGKILVTASNFKESMPCSDSGKGTEHIAVRAESGVMLWVPKAIVKASSRAFDPAL